MGYVEIIGATNQIRKREGKANEEKKWLTNDYVKTLDKNYIAHYT